jgi:hypothetical protein
MESGKRKLYEKAKRKLATVFLDAIQHTPLQFAAYRSYWNYQLKRIAGKGNNPVLPIHYIAQKPNYSAGIGHQLANWNAGYYFSHYFKLRFAHFPFSSDKWECLLGFGENEIKANALLADKTVKKVRLPRFDCNKDLERVGDIIKAYGRNKVLFLLAQDQGYERQYDTYASLSKKFFTAPARQQENLFYRPGKFNIAIHIRRGDIATMKAKDDANWGQRWLNNSYYASVLKQVLGLIKNSPAADIYIFSQGSKEDFPEFSMFNNIHYCLDVNAYDSFVHMVHADLLVSSKSSFSYKPALLSKGIKICPADFWHSYPANAEFVLAGNDGSFDAKQLSELLASKTFSLING